jgi:NAD+ kinase
VLSDKVTIRIQHSKDEEGFLSIDGQVGFPISEGEVVECRRAAHTVKLFRKSGSFFAVLHDKLKWG